jgi:hypothetical protein
MNYAGHMTMSQLKKHHMVEIDYNKWQRKTKWQNPNILTWAFSTNIHVDSMNLVSMDNYDHMPPNPSYHISQQWTM